MRKIKNFVHGLIAFLAAVYYRFPSRKLIVIGVTGTDGKTTTVHLIHHLLTSSGKKAALVSSLYKQVANKRYDTGFHVTTPNSWQLQKFLRSAIRLGVTHMVLEVTSHGLDQNRVLGINFKVGVLTNITHEHLDYHNSFRQYAQTKMKLIQWADQAIVNRDDKSYTLAIRSGISHVISYGIYEKAQVTLNNFHFTTPLPGEFNRYNCLAAIATCRYLGIPDTEIQKGLRDFTGVNGRFEEIPNQKGIRVIIDFAHTPNAFDQVLRTVKPDTKGKLIHVFGSAALRDMAKRPIMGEVSAKYADYIVLTEEDYRSENVNNIIESIAKGCLKQKAIEMFIPEVSQARNLTRPVFFRVPDRATAIEFAITRLARPDDTVILTGKAHEKSLCRGNVEYPWSEHETVEQALKKRR